MAEDKQERLPIYVRIYGVKYFCCQNCEYEWLPKHPDHEPVKCPECQSKKWRGDEGDEEEVKDFGQ
jgi:Zn finger protein HypA/HybF involved in hydrogenase expression